jgi:hypothetical protein
MLHLRSRAGRASVSLISAATMQRLIRAVESEILRIKSDIALLNLKTALRRHALAQLKANFNPAQPRDEIGRWTSDGGGGDEARVWLASDKKPEIPERPSTHKERLAAAKEFARRLVAIGRILRRLTMAGWLLEFAPEIRSYQDSPKTFDEIRLRALERPEAGYQDHHVAEQGPARDAGFPPDEE